MLQGNYLSDLCVYETGQQVWSQPSVVGTVPQPRSDTQMVRTTTRTTHTTNRAILCVNPCVVRE